MHWYQRDPNAALLGMANLSLAERGAYNTILDLLYAQDGVLVDDDTAVAKLLHVQTRTWRPIKAALIAKGKIWIADGMLMGKRVENTLKTAHKLSEKQSKIAHKRWEEVRKAKEINGGSMPVGNALHPHPQGRIEREEENGHPKKEKKGPPRHGAFTKDRARVWFNFGTAEWAQYADDYREHHGGIDPPMQWDGAGSWFNWSGEAQH